MVCRKTACISGSIITLDRVLVVAFFVLNFSGRTWRCFPQKRDFGVEKKKEKYEQIGAKIRPVSNFREGEREKRMGGFLVRKYSVHVP